MMGLFEECFGDLSKENQEKLKEQLNKINELVGLRKEE